VTSVLRHSIDHTWVWVLVECMVLLGVPSAAGGQEEEFGGSDAGEGVEPSGRAVGQINDDETAMGGATTNHLGAGIGD